MRIGSPGKILSYYYKSDLNAFGLKFAVEKFLKDDGRLARLDMTGCRLHYLPFYRFRGMTYSLLSEEKFDYEEVGFNDGALPSKIEFQQRCRNFDITIPGFGEKAFGLDSLGVRPDVIPLDIFNKANLPPESILVNTTASPDEARRIAMAMFAYNLGFATEGKQHIISEMIGEGLAIIYYPVWTLTGTKEGMPITYFVDGLSKRILSENPDNFVYMANQDGIILEDQFSPIPHRCPNCGADLPVSEASLVYYCSNCHRSYIVTSVGYRATRTRSAQFEQARGFHPFWRFSFSGGKGEKTVNDFSRILTGEIPLIAKNKAQIQFCLYVPGFKTPDLDSMTNRAIRLNRTQPIFEFTDDEIDPAAEMILPESEAVELARFYWQILRIKYRQLNSPTYDFKSCKIGPGELVWLTMTDFGKPVSAKVKSGLLSAR
jgi:predicted RNA-binding Zn-ribbon protein involved in translation (DUF1610 family)